MMFGEEQLKDLLTRCRGMQAKKTIDTINDELKKFVGNAEQSDDLTMFLSLIHI